MSERKELNAEMLDGVIGGLTYNKNEKTVWANDGSTPRYHYDDWKAVMAVATQYLDDNMTSKEFDAIVFPKLLEAGVIHE